MENVFDLIDRQEKPKIFGFNPFAILWNVNGWRNYFLLCIVGAGFCWAFFGFDSTWSMLFPFVENIGPLLRGETSFEAVWALSQGFYGIGNHFSAPVIYGLLWVLTSKNLIKQGVRGSMNFCVTTGLSLMNIGVFEWLWNGFYAVFQGQIWTITWRYKQVTNLFSFSAFILLGVLVCLYMVTGGYRLRFDRVFLVLATVSIVCWGLWINYPGEVTGLSVDLVDGDVWSNSVKFPQTYYAVDVDPGDGVAIGEPFYVGDDLIHLLNTFTKVVSTCAIGYLVSFKRVESMQ